MNLYWRFLVIRIILTPPNISRFSQDIKFTPTVFNELLLFYYSLFSCTQGSSMLSPCSLPTVIFISILNTFSRTLLGFQFASLNFSSLICQSGILPQLRPYPELIPLFFHYHYWWYNTDLNLSCMSQNCRILSVAFGLSFLCFSTNSFSRLISFSFLSLNVT